MVKIKDNFSGVFLFAVLKTYRTVTPLHRIELNRECYEQLHIIICFSFTVVHF